MRNTSPTEARNNFGSDDKQSDKEDVSKTEFVTEIILPEHGYWRWVVVAASFMCCFISQGIFFSFGSIYKNISEDLQVDVSLVALTNSLAIALLLLTGPIVSAFINRFGFRVCAMSGSMIVSFSYLIVYIAPSYAVFLIFYGVISGIGACCINMSALLVVGFYFESHRSLALGIAASGISFGLAIMFIINTYMVHLCGWRLVVLCQAGLFGTIFFISMVFRPLLSLSVTIDKEQAAKRSGSTSVTTIGKAAGSNEDTLLPSDTDTTQKQKLFSGVSNVHFPTVADVLEKTKSEDVTDGPGPSSAEKKHSFHQLREAGSTLALQSVVDIHIAVNNEKPQKKKHHWWLACCYWESHVQNTRPLYRDDAFYTGSIKKLVIYERGVLNTEDGSKTGLEYHMAVHRTATPHDLKESQGICSIAVRRVLATMLNPQLLKRMSFLLVCTANVLIHLGMLVPYIFLPDRNKSEGIASVHCDSFVSVIGLSSVVGRLHASLLAHKVKPVTLYSAGCIVAGTSLIVSNLSFNLYYQYGCCVMYGFSTAHMTILRSYVLVDLYGLDNLTNATGIVLMFAGVGTLISTPLSGVLMNHFGYGVSFYSMGICQALAGLIMINVKIINKYEAKDAPVWEKVQPEKTIRYQPVFQIKQSESMENIKRIHEIMDA